MTLYKPRFNTLALNCPSLFPLFPQPGSKWWLNRLLEGEKKKIVKWSKRNIERGPMCLFIEIRAAMVVF